MDRNLKSGQQGKIYYEKIAPFSSARVYINIYERTKKIGIGISLVLLVFINQLIHKLTGNPDITAVLPLISSIILICLSVVLTLIGGLIPSRIASKKDPVEALRTE